ncbi:MAG: hypothetical protein ACRBN8_14870 [Nannocystales bacterium]
MSNHSYSSRTLIALLALPLLGSAGCELELIAEHLPLADGLVYPDRHVAAVSDNHEHVFIASAVNGTLNLVSTNGTPRDEFSLSDAWRPLGAATYYGPDFEASGFWQHNEAALVLHRNGSILPWYHHGGELGFHWAGRIVVPAAPPTVASVTYNDVDQSRDGVVFVLADESRVDGTAQSRIWRRGLDGSWTSVVGPEKSSALAYDQHLDSLTVSYTRTDVRDITLREYGEDLSFTRSRTIPDLDEVRDFEVLAGWFYIGASACENASCTERTREFQVRNTSLALSDVVAVEVEAVALDLPPFPLDLDSNVDVWRAGPAASQLAEYDVVVP